MTPVSGPLMTPGGLVGGRLHQHRGRPSKKELLSLARLEVREQGQGLTHKSLCEKVKGAS